MKKLIMLATIVGLALTGCSASNHATAASPTVTVTAAPIVDTVVAAATAAPDADASFIAFVHKQWPDTATVADETVLSTGQTTCTALSNNTVDDVMAAAASSSATSSEDSTIITGAVFFLCPQYKAAVQDWSAAHGG